MTPRQRKYWQNHMQQLEIRMLRYYKKYPLPENEVPDGSFMMSALISGWDAGVRAKRKAKPRRK